MNKGALICRKRSQKWKNATLAIPKWNKITGMICAFTKVKNFQLSIWSKVVILYIVYCIYNCITIVIVIQYIVLYIVYIMYIKKQKEIQKKHSEWETTVKSRDEHYNSMRKYNIFCSENTCNFLKHLQSAKL